jgi:hypothetical protein
MRAKKCGWRLSPGSAFLSCAFVHYVICVVCYVCSSMYLGENRKLELMKIHNYPLEIGALLCKIANYNFTFMCL